MIRWFIRFLARNHIDTERTLAVKEHVLQEEILDVFTEAVRNQIRARLDQHEWSIEEIVKVGLEFGVRLNLEMKKNDPAGTT